MRVRVHPLCPVMLLCALFLGEGLRMTVLLVSVALHELSHVAAALALHVPVAELELMPCGGAARFEEVWGMRPGVLCLVALCGPLTNGLLACLSAALGWWGALPGEVVCLAVFANLCLMAFNLLPALPLDGGRILCALLMRRMPPAKAVRWGVRLGQAVGGLLIVTGCAMAALGQYNLTLILCGAYLLLSAPGEMRRVTSAAVQSLMGREKELSRRRAMPVRTLAVAPDLSPAELAAYLVPGKVHRFLIPGEKARILEERDLLRALLKESAPGWQGQRPPAAGRQGRQPLATAGQNTKLGTIN